MFEKSDVSSSLLTLVKQDKIQTLNIKSEIYGVSSNLRRHRDF